MRTSVKIIISLIVVIAVLVATFVGAYFIRDRQLFSNQASVPTGQVLVSLNPASATLSVGQTLPVTISIDPGGNTISGVAVRLKYNYSGSTPEVTINNITISSLLSTSLDWNCPVQSVTPANGVVTADISCVNTNTAGFTYSSSFPIATFYLTVSAVPGTNPVIITFDPLASIVTRKSDGDDILLTPTSMGNYTVSSTSPTGTPEPTPTNAPGTPNSCNGTCGSNANCESGLYCYQGFCRNASCPSSSTCSCSGIIDGGGGGGDASLTPTPTPGQLLQTGVVENTIIIIGTALLLLGTSALLAL